MTRWMKNFCIGISVAALVLLGFYRFWMYPRYVVPILMYHYVDGKEWSLSVSPESFKWQMKYLDDHHYHVISLDDFVAQRMAGKKIPHHTVVITFDDGTQDNYTVAYPILKKHGFPATIFLITDRVGIESDGLTYLNWEQIEEMSRNGICFGSHTQNHSYVPNLTREELMIELVNSKKMIEKHLSKSIHHFCYPLGGFTEDAKEVIQDAGYSAAVTTNRGNDRDNVDLYELERVKVSDGDAVKPFRFWGKLSGYYNLFRKTRPGY